MQPTMTLDEANRLADQYIHRALDALPTGATLSDPTIFRDSECDDPSDEGPLGRKFASHIYEIVGLDPQRIPSYFDTLRTWWEGNDFAVLKDDRRAGREFLWVENKQDSFRMTLKANDLGEMYLIASSPCVWPDGTPNP